MVLADASTRFATPLDVSLNQVPKAQNPQTTHVFVKQPPNHSTHTEENMTHTIQPLRPKAQNWGSGASGRRRLAREPQAFGWRGIATRSNFLTKRDSWLAKLLLFSVTVAIGFRGKVDGKSSNWRSRLVFTLEDQVLPKSNNSNKKHVPGVSF